MIGAVDTSGAVDFLSQGALLGYGLDVVRRTRRGNTAPIVSLVSPGSFGGLIAGPLAALLSGATLHFLSPFRAASFLRLLNEIGPARLVAPSAILPDLSQAGLLNNGALLSCTTLSTAETASRATISEGACPIIEFVCAGDAVRISTLAHSEETARVA